jgi:hypothetical protein
MEYYTEYFEEFITDMIIVKPGFDDWSALLINFNEKTFALSKKWFLRWADV